MNRRLKQLGGTGLLLASLLLVGPAPGEGSHESFAVYEDWTTSRTIRSDRWTARDDGPVQEIGLGIRGHKLVMRQRREGATISNVGLLGRSQFIFAKNASAIDQLEAAFKVRRLVASSCALNPGNTRVRAAALALSAFNDGTSIVGQIGDHFVAVVANREADSSEPEGVLTVQAFLFRCQDSACFNPLSNIFNLAVGTVLVGEPFTLRAVWDGANARFLIGVNDQPDVVLAYNPTLDHGPAHGPFAEVHQQGVTGNCAAGPTITDVETEVREVRTNASAIVP